MSQPLPPVQDPPQQSPPGQPRDANPLSHPRPAETAPGPPPFDFGGARFDLDAPRDREILRFILSQALYGEATGVYCGKSLYAARSLEAAFFYVRQASQELGHLMSFADVFRMLDLAPSPPHRIVRWLSAHNNYYPLKVFMEHAVGERMVLDVFKDVLLQTLPPADPRVPAIRQRLAVICDEEKEHVAWGEKETRRLIAERPWLRTPYYGLLEIQLLAIRLIVRSLRARAGDHPVLSRAGEFTAWVGEDLLLRGREMGYVPLRRQGPLRRGWAMTCGLALLLRSRLARSRSKLDHTYLRELGFEGGNAP
jgi:hypothetical protein